MLACIVAVILLGGRQSLLLRPFSTRTGIDSISVALTIFALIQLQAQSTQAYITPLTPEISILPAQPAIALGWGQTTLHPSSFSDVLQEVTLPIVEQTLCQQTYLGEFNISDIHLCAGFTQGGQDTCTGDSGGPLILFDGTSWRQAGITSFGGHLNGPACAGENAYGVYTRVSMFTEFIAETTHAELIFEGVKNIYSADEPVIVDVAEILPGQRSNVDLWFGLSTGEHLFFISGTDEFPLFSLAPLPLADIT